MSETAGRQQTDSIFEIGDVLGKATSLFFELSNEDRIRILIGMKKKPQRLVDISKEMGIKIQEASRHINRLSRARLLSRDENNHYRLTPFGEAVLFLLGGLKFALKNADIFKDHSLLFLPPKFVSRIGELKDYRRVDEFMESFDRILGLLSRAEKYIHIVSDQILLNAVSIIRGRVLSGVEYKILLPEDMPLPPDIKPIPLTIGKVYRRTMKEVSVFILATEKEALLFLPDLNGKIDFSMLLCSRDSSFHDWCEDLFQFYWAQAKVGPPKSYPEEYHKNMLMLGR